MKKIEWLESQHIGCDNAIYIQDLTNKSKMGCSAILIVSFNIKENGRLKRFTVKQIPKRFMRFVELNSEEMDTYLNYYSTEQDVFNPGWMYEETDINYESSFKNDNRLNKKHPDYDKDYSLWVDFMEWCSKNGNVWEYKIW